MELARLASSKQAAASKLALQGPFQAPEQQGSQNRKKMLPLYPGWFSTTFSGTTFFSVGPPPVGNGENTENTKMQFPSARGTFGGGNPAAPKVSPQNWATFVRFLFWPTRPPGAGNRETLVF